MKNLKFNYKILLSAMAIVVGFNACQDSDNVIDQVVDGTTSGAVLRTIEIGSNTLNSSEPASFFSVTVEEQDTQDGALFESVDVLVSIRDLTPDNDGPNGPTVADDFFIKNIPASEFSTGPLGLPRGTIAATFAEAEAAMGLNSSQYAPGDLFVFELQLKLTDGRVYGAADAGGIITGGFFSSPYIYNAAIVCSPEPGDYQVDMHDSYGDGWQGDGISITLTDNSGNATVVYADMLSSYAGGPSCCTWTDSSETITVPVGTATAIWEFTGDSYPGEISFEIYAPDGSLLLAVAEGEAVVGLLPVTNCL
jgi:hypothetical protein